MANSKEILSPLMVCRKTNRPISRIWKIFQEKLFVISRTFCQYINDFQSKELYIVIKNQKLRVALYVNFFQVSPVFIRCTLFFSFVQLFDYEYFLLIHIIPPKSVSVNKFLSQKEGPLFDMPTIAVFTVFYYSLRNALIYFDFIG